MFGRKKENKIPEIEQTIFPDQPPQYILDELKIHGVQEGDILLCALSDLDRSGNYADTYLVVTKTKVLVLAGPVWEGPAGSTTPWQTNEVRIYSMAEIEKAKSDSMISTGVLTLTVKGEDLAVLAFTNSAMHKFGECANIISRLLEGKEVTKKEFRKSNKIETCPKCGMPYPDRDRKICPKCMDRRALFMRVLSYAPKYKKELVVIILALLAVTGLGLIRPLLNGTVLYDHVLENGGSYYGRIGAFVAVLFGLEVLILAVNVLQGRMVAKVASKIIYDIKCEVFGAMQNLSMSFYNSKQTGSLMTRVNGDALHVQYFLVDGAPYFITNSLSLIGVLTVMFTFNWKLTLMVLIPVPLIIFMIKKVFPCFHLYRWHTWQKQSRLNALINDTLSGMRVVKAFGKEGREVDRFEKSNSELFEMSVRTGRMNARTFPVASYIMTLGSLFVWGIGGWQVVTGSSGMTFGILMTFVGYIGMIYGPVDFLTNSISWWADCMTSAQRIFEIIDKVPEIQNARNPVSVNPIKGDIVLDNITFEYEPNKPVLHNVQLHIEAGEMVGLVGHSGAGKSTITNLITRLYDVTDGEIRIDGVNVKDIDLKDLRSQVGMVLQDTFLFTGSVAQNIAYARPESTMEEIMAAAKLANAHDFITKLPDGYDTVIGARKKNLSGGEKQRISIARAILLNPRILILDEATASVDTETERQIQEALERLVTGRTTIAIAHRLSTLRNANRLVVVDKGRIVEIGTHEELENMKGKYYDMLQIQKKALKLEGIDDEDDE